MAGAAGQDDEQAEAGQALDHGAERLRRGIDPVHVLDRNHQWSLTARVDAELTQDLDGPHLYRVRADLRRVVRLTFDAEEAEQIWKRLRRLHLKPLEAGPDLVRDASGRVDIRKTPGVLQELPHGQIRNPGAVRNAMTLEIDDALPPQALTKLVEQPRFPYARLADDADDLPLSGARRFQTAPQQREFLPPSHEGSHVPLGREPR